MFSKGDPGAVVSRVVKIPPPSAVTNKLLKNRKIF